MCWSGSNDADATIARTAARRGAAAENVIFTDATSIAHLHGLTFAFPDKFRCEKGNFAVRQNWNKISLSAYIWRVNFRSYAISIAISGVCSEKWRPRRTPTDNLSNSTNETAGERQPFGVKVLCNKTIARRVVKCISLYSFGII